MNESIDSVENEVVEENLDTAEDTSEESKVKEKKTNKPDKEKETEVSDQVETSLETEDSTKVEPKSEDADPKDKEADKTNTNTEMSIENEEVETKPSSETEAPAEADDKKESKEIKIEMGIGSEIKPETEEKGDAAFLELDKATQQRMKDIEEEEKLAAEDEELKEVGIFAIKTSIGHEKMVANWLSMRVRKRKLDVYAILSPPKLRGYLLLEGVKNKEALQDLIKGVQHARSVVEGNTSLDEIEHFLTPKPLVSGIEEGDVVEIIAGPFKGEKAKVTQIDESKEEITVELFEAMVSIPVTIRGDHVRILEKERS